MSSRSEKLSRIGPVALFVALLGASTLVLQGMTPLLTPPATPPALARSIDRGVAILARAKRPYQDVVFSESLKAFVPDLVPLSTGAVLLPETPVRPVILGQKHAPDYLAIRDRAARDGLTWSAGIGGQEVVAFAADEAHFRAAMAKAGLELQASEVLETSPLLASLQTQMRGVADDAGAWSIPAHAGDALILYGPYVEEPAGNYRLNMHVQLEGTPPRCRAAAAQFAPTVSVTGDMGTRVLLPKTVARVTAAAADPCSLAIEVGFTVPAGGAHKVETPFSGASALPMTVDGYSLSAAPSAHSR